MPQNNDMVARIQQFAAEQAAREKAAAAAKQPAPSAAGPAVLGLLSALKNRLLGGDSTPATPQNPRIVRE